ncbi:reverse transcriptase N-terminal domain-containing protein [Wolbachia endosymbiont (group B) of Melanostoma mellinum]|uniref:reverse transcriptase N-terminal domain-containing protein n=1 Tax=Wolbachia endosymbiont (group B) of Melanostoma mellinum TaxID=2954030 RepID=UPI002230CF46|nr:reverse transcriptase N-terminal domain-containing protein [Wolbachia endosymbiont (group B) of Melanostoma mellinum]
MSSSKYVMNRQKVRYEWNEIPWRKLEKFSFKLQKRIYRASKSNNIKMMHSLQKLLLKSTSARVLAVRRVTQDNRGKKTAGIDGKANLNQKERMQLAYSMDLREKAKPSKRVWIPKPGKPLERRPLGIPTISCRAKQTLVKMILEPEWEAKFESNTYQLCFLKIFYLCNFATLPNHVGNKNPFVIGIEFYVKQLLPA